MLDLSQRSSGHQLAAAVSLRLLRSVSTTAANFPGEIRSNNNNNSKHQNDFLTSILLLLYMN